MNRRRAALLGHLVYVGGACPVWAIVEHMQQRHGMTPHATRQMLWRLHNEGVVTRVRWGYYQIGTAASGGASNNTADLTTQRSYYYTEG